MNAFRPTTVNFGGKIDFHAYSFFKVSVRVYTGLKVQLQALYFMQVYNFQSLKAYKGQSLTILRKIDEINVFTNTLSYF